VRGLTTEQYSLFVFQVSESVNAFREYKVNTRRPNEIMHDLRMRLKTLPVATAECERGFSLMNRLQTPDRNRLQIDSMR